MVCPHCGTSALPGSLRCVSCDSDLSGLHDADVTGAGITGTATLDLTAAPAIPRVAGSPLQPGQKFGTRYTVIKVLGAGGMGAVYQAWDESLNTAVALKVILVDPNASADDLRQLEARFKRELLLARKVTHPNVVRIHDLGELGQTKYLTMAYVDGADLSTVLRRDGKMPVPRALHVMRQITEGLKAAHDLGIVHRDLKPANVMIEAEDRALLTDFGIARSIDASTLHTAPGSIVGTLNYMAPEQARGEPADRRTDVFAMGLIFYELLTGGKARAASTDFFQLLAKVQSGPPPIAEVAPDLPAAVVKIVNRCVEQNPDARYQSAGELLDDLNKLDADGREVAPIAARPVRSRGWTVGVAAAAAVLLVVLAGAGWWLSTRPAGAPAAPVAQAPVSILIADFENRANDPVFEGALEQALAIAMEGASFVTSYSRPAAVKLAGQLGAGTTLNASAASLVGVRENIGAVLAGTIEQRSPGYHLEIRAFKPGPNQEPISAVEADAADKSKVLEAVGHLAADLRKALGDTKPSSELQAETVSVGSLDALREYNIAQGLSTDRKNEEAIVHYKAAVGHDPQFGRAYAGWALAAFDLGRHDEASEQWKRALALADRMTEREQYRTFGGYYLGVTRNFDKAIESYSALVEKYPADLAGHNNLALAYFYTRNFEKAFEFGKRAIDAYPNSLKFRNNYALYAMYAGQFKTAAENAQQVLKEDPKYDVAYLPLAMAAFTEGDMGRAREVYGQARNAGPSGASLAAAGLADIALFEGKPAEAVAILEPAITVDRESRNTLGVATKTIALAEARAALSGAGAALPLLGPVSAGSPEEYTAVPSARLLAAARQEARSRELAKKLEERSTPLARAYARIIEGEILLQQRRFTEAIPVFSAALKEADLWLARFDLGVAYAEAGKHVEALDEFKACLERRGEATSLFFDDIPTYRYAAVLPYWQARAQQGLGQSAAAAGNFEQFLKARPSATNDPLAADARKRLDALRGSR